MDAMGKSSQKRKWHGRNGSSTSKKTRFSNNLNKSEDGAAPWQQKTANKQQNPKRFNTPKQKKKKSKNSKKLQQFQGTGTIGETATETSTANVKNMPKRKEGQESLKSRNFIDSKILEIQEREKISLQGLDQLKLLMEWRASLEDEEAIPATGDLQKETLSEQGPTTCESDKNDNQAGEECEVINAGEECEVIFVKTEPSWKETKAERDAKVLNKKDKEVLQPRNSEEGLVTVKTEITEKPTDGTSSKDQQPLSFFIDNSPATASKQETAAHFTKPGKIQEVKIPIEPETVAPQINDQPINVVPEPLFQVQLENLPVDTRVQEICEHFGKVGRIMSINIPACRETKMCQGFAYIYVAGEEAYNNALLLNQTSFKGQDISVYPGRVPGYKKQDTSRHPGRPPKAMKRFYQKRGQRARGGNCSARPRSDNNHSYFDDN